VVVRPPIASPEERAREHRKRVLFRIPGTLSYGWIATFIYVRLRSSRLAARALANAEIERSEAQRKLLAAQLVAAHAQVDPAFVLEKLEEVERAYEVDPARADRLLDEFIAFLRDAIPRLRADEGGQAA
jgi:LytS/YehU family sensor histidine kinase